MPSSGISSGSPSTRGAALKSTVSSSARLEAFDKDVRGPIIGRKLEVLSTAAACLPDADAKSHRALLRTGKLGAHGRMVGLEVSGTHRLIVEPGSAHCPFCVGIDNGGSSGAGKHASRNNCSAFCNSSSNIETPRGWARTTSFTFARKSVSIDSRLGRKMACCFRRTIRCHRLFFIASESSGNESAQILLKELLFFLFRLSRRFSATIEKDATTSATM